jgi:predicted HTH domain antitoxin
MSVTIADNIIQASKLTPQEFCQEIALHFFQTDRLSLNNASQLAEMPPKAFRALLKQHNIPLYAYDVEDFDLDLQNLTALGRFQTSSH